MRRLTPLLAAALLAATAPLLSACADSGEEQGSASFGHGDEGGVVLSDSWAKAGEAGGMTSVFGTLTNHTDEPISFSGMGSTSPVAEGVEFHEVVDGGMRMIEQELVIPAGGSLELAPGAHHLMLMGLQQDLLAGEEITIEFIYGEAGDPRHDIGYIAEFTVLVKDYAGANESYEDHGDHDGH